MTQVRQFIETPLRIEINWGKRSFVGTVHPASDVSDSYLDLTLSESTRWEPTQPYPSFFGVRGQVTLDSPEGQYSPTAERSALPQLTEVELQAASAIRISYREWTGMGFAGTWTVYWEGLVSGFEQRGRVARGTLREFNRAFLDERVVMSELSMDRFEGDAVGTLVMEASLGGRDYPPIVDYVLGAVTYSGSRRALVNAAANWMAAWPYSLPNGQVRFFEALNYERAAEQRQDFTLEEGEFAALETSVVTLVDSIATRVPFDFGGAPPLPGPYPIAIANEEWVLAPGESFTRTYDFPAGDTYEPRLDYGLAQLVSPVGKLAESLTVANFPSGYVSVGEFEAALGFAVATDDPTFAQVNFAGKPTVNVAHPLTSEIENDVTIEVQQTGPMQIRVTARNTATGTDRIVFSWLGPRTRYRQVFAGTINYNGTTRFWGAGSNAGAIAGAAYQAWLAGWVGRSGQRLVSHSASTTVYEPGDNPTFPNGAVRIDVSYVYNTDYYIQEAYTVTELYELLGSPPQFTYRFNLPIGVRSSTDPTQSGRRYVFASELALDRYGDIDAAPPRWYDSANNEVAAAEELVELLSFPRRLFRLQLAADHLEGSFQQTLAIRPGHIGGVAIRDALTNTLYSAEAFVIGRTLRLLHDRPAEIGVSAVELLARTGFLAVTPLGSTLGPFAWQTATIPLDSRNQEPARAWPSRRTGPSTWSTSPTTRSTCARPLGCGRPTPSRSTPATRPREAWRSRLTGRMLRGRLRPTPRSTCARPLGFGRPAHDPP